MPAIVASAKGVSCTRSLPKRSCSPAVARNTPPLAPTSCPITTTFASCCISQPCASAMASIIVIFAKSMTAGFRSVFSRRCALRLQVRGQSREQMLEHRIRRRLGRCEVRSHGGLDLIGACLLQIAFLRRVPDPCVDEKFTNPSHGLEIPGRLDLLLAAVAVGVVRGRMIAQAIRQRLDDPGTRTTARGFQRLAQDFPNRE